MADDHDCVDWNSGGACFICHKPIPVDVPLRATEEGARYEKSEMLPVPPTDEGVHSEAAPLRSKPCPACGAETFEDGRHQRDDTPPPYCALCGSGRTTVAVSLDPHRLPTTWTCPYCRHREDETREGWRLRAADHLDDCDRNPRLRGEATVRVEE